MHRLTIPSPDDSLSSLNTCTVKARQIRWKTTQANPRVTHSTRFTHPTTAWTCPVQGLRSLPSHRVSQPTGHVQPQVNAGVGQAGNPAVMLINLPQALALHLAHTLPQPLKLQAPVPPPLPYQHKLPQCSSSTHHAILVTSHHTPTQSRHPSYPHQH